MNLLLANSIHKELCQNSSTQLLKMRGSSMAADGIRDGDILVVEKNFEEANGKIILAWLEGTLMVRRLDIQGRKMRLLTGGNYFSPLEIDPYCNFKILGVVQFVVHRL